MNHKDAELDEQKSESSEKLNKEKSKEAYLAKRETERTARIEHRRTRRPRTQGVLFKRLPDGTIVNADLSESDLAKRRKGKHANQKDPSDDDVKIKLSRGVGKNGRASDTPSPSIAPNTDNQEEKNERLKAKFQRPRDPIAESSEAKMKSEQRDKKKSVAKDSMVMIKETSSPIENDHANGAREQDIVHTSPPVSAWRAGPPPGIFKNGLSNVTQSQTATDREHDSKGSLIDAQVDVLSSKLLSSWSSKDALNAKVAKGPIISSWSPLSGNDAGLFQSFHSSKQESTAGGTDWSMDFALPRDLLSPTAEDNAEPSTHVDQAHNTDLPASSSNRASSESKKNPRSFTLSKKKPRFATRTQPNESDSRSKSSNPHPIPMSTSETNESDRKPKSNTRRFPKRNKKAKAETQ